jgi:D-alanyl-D-alanine carboxypeptidase/D-alanyl-D-alanine-endopeptidase (penicillin-binding protein 4)
VYIFYLPLQKDKIVNMKHKIIIATVLFIAGLTISQPVAAQSAAKPKTAAQTYFDKTITQKGIRESVVAAMAVTASGDTLLSHNCDMLMTPASCMKLITTGVALQQLGESHTWKTRLGYDGTISADTLKGNLYIIGGADPFLGSKDSLAFPIEKTFAQWKDSLAAAGIKHIEGMIIGDGRWIDGPMEEQNWLYEDLGTDYGAGVSGLNFYENAQSFTISAGSAVGAKVMIRPHYPLPDWMNYHYNVTTGKAGTGDKTYLFTTTLSPHGEFRGTFAIDRAPKTLNCSNKFPEYTCARIFTDYLSANGITAKGTSAAQGYFCSITPTPQEELKIIATTSSPSLGKVIYTTNYESNNVFAETLLRTLGKEKTSSACYDSSRVALERGLIRLGLGTREGIKIGDGSGLSRKNLVSPAYLCKFLCCMLEQDGNSDIYFNSLPYPGANGTMRYRMSSYPESLKKRIHYKSGSMEGVRCFSGYIAPGSWFSGEGSQEVIVFSIMINNTTTPNGTLQTLIDRTIERLAKVNL